MKSGSATTKVSGGKLVRVEVSWSDRLETVKITGDFFLHPEEMIIEIEKQLIGLALPLDQETIVIKINNLLNQFQAQLIGASPTDVVNTLLEAMTCNSE